MATVNEISLRPEWPIVVKYHDCPDPEVCPDEQYLAQQVEELDTFESEYRDVHVTDARSREVRVVMYNLNPALIQCLPPQAFFTYREGCSDDGKSLYVTESTGSLVTRAVEYRIRRSGKKKWVPRCRYPEKWDEAQVIPDVAHRESTKSTEQFHADWMRARR